jgi:hypothetical protein
MEKQKISCECKSRMQWDFDIKTSWDNHIKTEIIKWFCKKCGEYGEYIERTNFRSPSRDYAKNSGYRRIRGRGGDEVKSRMDR